MTFPSACRPPPSGTALGQWEISVAAQLRPLREAVLDAMTMDGVQGEIVDKIVVVATELATNVLKHATPPAFVLLCRSGGCYLIDVVDHDPAIPLRQAGDRPSASGGYGLALTQQLAGGFGWYVAATTKHVWASFAHPAFEDEEAVQREGRHGRY